MTYPSSQQFLRQRLGSLLSCSGQLKRKLRSAMLHSSALSHQTSAHNSPFPSSPNLTCFEALAQPFLLALTFFPFSNRILSPLLWKTTPHHSHLPGYPHVLLPKSQPRAPAALSCPSVAGGGSEASVGRQLCAGVPAPTLEPQPVSSDGCWAAVPWNGSWI